MKRLVISLHVLHDDCVLCSAETQGKTDQYISTWLKQQKREDIVLATKVRCSSARLSIPSKSHPVLLPFQHLQLSTVSQ